MTRADEWARVDYRSRAMAIICAIATTLVATVTLTAYVATQVGFAEGALLPTPPREAAFVAQQCPPRYVHQIFGLKKGDDEVPAPWRRAQKSWTSSSCRWSRRSSGSRPRVAVPCGGVANNGACRARVSSIFASDAVYISVY